MNGNTTTQTTRNTITDAQLDALFGKASPRCVRLIEASIVEHRLTKRQRRVRDTAAAMVVADSHLLVGRVVI
jgi:hypothetical protein